MLHTVIDEAVLRQQYHDDVDLHKIPIDQGVHVQGTIKRFTPGSRCIMSDGRVFKYGFAKTALLGGFGAANYFPVSKHVTYAVIPTAAAVGDAYLDVTYPSSCGYASAGFVADELAGGSITVGHNAANVENFQITKHEAIAATTSTVHIFLDQPVGVAHPVTDGAEAFANPYAYLGKGSLDYNAFMGVPARNVTISNYAWIQTWGPAWVCPGGADSVPGNSADDRMVYFVGDGSVNGGTAITIESGYQPAGFIIDTTASGTGAGPIVMLQISL